MAKRRKNTANKLVYTIVAAVLLALIAFFQNTGLLPENVNTPSGDEVYFHVIDVGQGSSSLIQKGSKAILIDGGERDYGQTVADYITGCGISELSYVIASHPHSDHIGGLITVLDKFNVGEVLMPEIAEENVPTTRTYENFLDAIAENDLSASYCEVGDIYYLDGISVEILAPVEQTDDMNNMSAVCKVTYGETDIMILGDAENEEISSFYKKNVSYKSEILVMGHHGSRTSIHKGFLNSVKPEAAVISCGLDNSYNHPHEETIAYLEDNNIEYYRTDYSGDVVFSLSENSFEKVKK